MLGIKADIRLDGVMIKADIAYSNAVKYKKSIFAPSVMGPFSYLQLSCNHCVVSMDLKAHGSLSINGKAQVFYCGGYIEKDYGKSFPKNYLWLHAAGQGVNIMFSYAWPLLFGIRGFLCIVQHEGRQYNFSLYSGAKIRSLKISGDSSQVMLTKGNNRLIFEADSGHGGQKLIAPGKQGRMTNQIRENLQAGFWCKLTLGGREIDVSGINKCAYECVLESNKISESVSLAPGKVMPAGRFAASNSFEAAEDAGDTSD